jgi:hypothetical protein
LAHFFQDLAPRAVDPNEAKREIGALRERQRGRALIWKRKNPGDANALARHYVNDAMGILKAYPEFSR